MPMPNDFRHTAKLLAECLNLEQPPVSVCFADSIPPGVKPYAGRVAAGCQFWEQAAKEGFATSADDHSRCAVGVYTHHLEPMPGQQADLEDALRVFSDLGYLRPEDLKAVPTLSWQPAYVLYAPLAETSLQPDVVVLFVNASQSLILSEATQQVEDRNPPAMGRPACSLMAQVVNGGGAAMSLGCCGARAYLDSWSESTVVFAIPGAKLAAYAERIEALAGANRVLSKFHQQRRRDIESGQNPTIRESLAAMG